MTFPIYLTIFFYIYVFLLLLRNVYKKIIVLFCICISFLCIQCVYPLLFLEQFEFFFFIWMIFILFLLFSCKIWIRKQLCMKSLIFHFFYYYSVITVFNIIVRVIRQIEYFVSIKRTNIFSFIFKFLSFLSCF